MIVVESGQRMAHSWPGDVTAAIGKAGGAEHLQQGHAQSVVVISIMALN